MKTMILFFAICATLFILASPLVYCVHRKLCGERYSKSQSVEVTILWVVASAAANIACYAVTHIG